MENIVLQAELRATGRHALRELRDGQRVPGVVYGAHQAPQPISVEARALQKALHAAGSGLVSLQLGTAEPLRVLAREVQHHPVKHYTLHVDFQAVSMTEKLRLDVPIIHEGTAPAMSNQDVVLVRHVDSIEVECLPADIPQHLAANLASLKTLHDEVAVKDLVVPTGVKILAEPNQVLFSLTMSSAAAEEEAPAATPAPDEVEVVAKGKPKEEEAAPAKK